MFKKILAGFLIVVSFNSCLKGSNSTACNYDACALKASASEIAAVQDYLTTNAIVATQHCSGLFYRIETQGTGSTPNACSNIAVNYVASLTNGTIFDSSTTGPSFSLSQLIPGWRDGLPLLNAGGRIWLYIPPTLGYGSTATGPIPANSILIFRVDLIAVQ